jgi:peptidoglycan/LPS O-acetylase OafA/YrhL
MILVLFCHLHNPFAPWDSLAPVEKFVFSVTKSGTWGLDSFFVLSGFLITGILYDTKGRGHYFRNFYMRRLLRVFPLYYGALFLFLFVVPLFKPLYSPGYEGPRNSTLWLWLYGLNVAHVVYEGNVAFSDWVNFDHFWSLCVEEHFYLFWPFVVLALGRRSLMVLCGILIVAAPALRIWLTLAEYHFSAAYWLTPSRMDSIALGGFLAVLLRGPVNVTGVVRKARLVAWLTVPVLPLMVWFHYDPEAWFSHPVLMWTHIQTLSIVAFFCGALLVVIMYAPPDSLTGRFWNSRLLQFFGNYSYAIYVFHALLYEPFGWITHALAVWLSSLHWRLAVLLEQPSYAYILLYTLVGITLSVLIALASWHLYEKHLLKLKKYFA